MTKKEVISVLVDYYDGAMETKQEAYHKLSERKRFKFMKIANKSRRDWQKLPCDSQGPTLKQHLMMDACLNSTVNEILKAIE